LTDFDLPRIIILKRKGFTINSRERLRAVLEGQIPDRVPISTYELVGYNRRIFENNGPSYARLMQVIREKTDCLCMWDPGSNVRFLESSYPVEVPIQESRRDHCTVCEKTVHTPKGDLTQITKITDHIHTIWEVERWCKSLDAAKPNGRYVIMPTVAPINTPLSRQTEENYLCFIETALEYGVYE